jgi:hypothetical protein
VWRAAGCAVFLVWVCGAHQALAGDPIAGPVAVVDGDTIRVGDTRV